MGFKYLQESTEGELFPSRYAYKYLERGMKFVGWLPPSRSSGFYWLYKLWSVIIIFTMAIYLPIAFFGSYFIDFEGFTPGDFLTSVQVAFNAACLALKIFLLVPHMDRFEEAKKMLDVIDERCVRQEDRVEVHRCVARCNFIYMIYQGVYSSYATLTYLSSAITGSTPWGFYLPFVDYRDGVKSFWIAATVEYIIGSAAVYSDQMIDIYPVIFGVLLRTHLKLLRGRVRRLRTTPGETDEQSYKELVSCIKDHKLLLQFCDVFRSVISGTIFAQFLVIGLGLGLSMMNLLFFSNLLTGLATSAFIVVLMIETFPFCYICELIEEDCHKLTSVIFHSNWIDANRRYKSTLVYFLHQTQQSINFIAGGIFPISMKTNIEVAKLAFTVVTVVKQMNIVEKLMKD
ncbi:odorant receptor 42b-like [Drosophila albomicans]|uniref:Odorant receptor n=1 Tax=Drosophila albomicans TaxID=7291 RepID=A0A6P8X3S0_DROAB|nr:odorant receptor 42b-like [Drosophila albomicans]